MSRWNKSAVVAGLATIFLSVAPSNAQDAADAIIADYAQRFTAVSESVVDEPNAAVVEQRLSEGSSIIAQLAADSRLTPSQRVSLESAMRCWTQNTLDEVIIRRLTEVLIDNPDAGNAELAPVLETTLNVDFAGIEVTRTLDVVTQTRRVETLTDIEYVETAAQCLWDRSERVQQTVLSNTDFELLYRDDIAVTNLRQSMALYLLYAESAVRLMDIESQLRARHAVSERYFYYSAFLINHPSHTSSGAQSLRQANEFAVRLIGDVSQYTSNSQPVVELLLMQIRGNLINRASEYAAELAVEFVAATGEESRNAASGMVVDLSEHDVGTTPSYLQHLERLYAERGW